MFTDKDMFRHLPPNFFRQRRRRSKPTKRRKQNSGKSNIYRKVKADQALATLVNTPEATRMEYVRLIWAYIKANQLQSRKDGRVIIPDARLATVMGVVGQEMNGFTVLRYLEQHIIKNPGSTRFVPGQNENLGEEKSSKNPETKILTKSCEDHEEHSQNSKPESPRVISGPNQNLVEEKPTQDPEPGFASVTPGATHNHQNLGEEQPSQEINQALEDLEVKPVNRSRRYANLICLGPISGKFQNPESQGQP